MKPIVPNPKRGGAAAGRDTATPRHKKPKSAPAIQPMAINPSSIAAGGLRFATATPQAPAPVATQACFWPDAQTSATGLAAPSALSQRPG